MLHVLALAGSLLGVQPDPLAGPAIAARVTRPTLVSYDMNGRLLPVETAPEIAAVALLRLPAELRETVEKVIAERAAKIDRFVSENLLLLGQLDSASKAGGKLDTALVLIEVLKRLKPAVDGPPLQERIAAALPEAEAGRFRGFLSEYWAALIDDDVRQNRAQGKNDARWAIAIGERFGQLAQEVARSFERQSASGTIFVDYLLAGLELTEDQRQTVRELELGMLERANFQLSEKDQRDLAFGILAHLDARQRAVVIKRVGGQ